MKPLDWMILAAVAVCALLCIRRILRKKGGCSCDGNCEVCTKCRKNDTIHQ